MLWHVLIGIAVFYTIVVVIGFILDPIKGVNR